MAGSVFGGAQFAGMAGAPQAMQMAYMRDPRLRLAQQLALQGADTSPVQSPWQGAARLAQALMGGWQSSRVNDEYAKQAEQYQNDMRALYAPVMEQGAAGPGPRQGPGGATMRPANLQEMTARLRDLQSPYALQEARGIQQLALQQQAQIEAERRAAEARGRYEPVMGDDGKTPIGQRNTASGRIEPMPQTSVQPPGVREYEFARSQGYQGSFLDYQREKAAAGTSAGQESWGLAPQMGTDAQGNPVMLQFSNRGQVRAAPLPQGVSPAPGQTSRIDLGTEWGILDRNGQIIQRVPKDVAGEAGATVRGRREAEQIADAPASARQAEQMLTAIEGILNDPSLPTTTGALAWTGIIPGTPMRGFAARADQLSGQAFLQAFESLKGGGAITEVEGQKATQAIARLDRAQRSDDYRAALRELQGIVQSARDRAMARIPEAQRGSVLPPRPEAARPPARPQPQAPAQGQAPDINSLLDRYAPR